jgi:hypothetical protein
LISGDSVDTAENVIRNATRMVQYPSTKLIRARVLQEDDDSSSSNNSTSVATDVATGTDKLYVDKFCQVSNDPPEDGEIPDLKLCNFREFRCESDTASNYNTGESNNVIIVPYQFELYYNPEANFEQLVQFFEEASLEHLASVTGTRSCSALARRHRRYTRRQLQDFTADQLTVITGVGREPDDVLDERFTDCVGQVSDEIAISTTCAPMLGGFSLFLVPDQEFTEDDEMALKDAVRSVLRTGMESDLYTAPGNIEKVVYVENREPILSDAKDVEVEGNGGGASSKAIGLMAGAGGLLVLILIAVLAMFRRRQKEVAAMTPDDAKLDEAESLDGSLAEQDSLALAPQELMGIPEEGYTQEEYENAKPIAVPTPVSNLVVVGRALGPRGNSSEIAQDSTFEGVYMTDDDTARTGDEIQAQNLATVSDLERSVVAEAESGEQEYVPEESEKPAMKRYGSGEQEYVPEEAEKPIIRRYGSEEYDQSLASSYAHSEDYETSSEYTPRRVLQMN